MKAMALCALALFSAASLPVGAAEHASSTCQVGENSAAACAGKWLMYVGNTGNLDEAVWVVRIDSETGEVYYKDGKKFVKVAEPK